MPTYTLIASNGRETDGDDPTPTWGYIEPEPEGGWDFQFVDQVEYREGDTVRDAITRFQDQGKLPVGEVRVARGEYLGDYWIHKDHLRSYSVTIQ